ncbi:di-trans,poly-cis-decaprenylcistransferase [Patescibacteria group bacterium]|nr:MAG: di-trans,poly-cis-decaprenylcistransferase [Patescibacteria group bacterium]
MSQTSPTTPTHVAVIPDGNRRWAKAKGLETKEGHKAGYQNLLKIADLAFDRGVKYVTGYVFSTENWSRTEEEVGYLMKLVGWVLKEEGKRLHDKGIRINIIGSSEGVDEGLLEGFDKLQKLTRHNSGGTINICFNYGGRRDIVEAVNKLLASGVKSVDESSFGEHLSTAGIPDPDLIIRTSGEQRLSNYLIWESAYSELYFSDVMWPDFNEAEFDAALTEYAKRKRNFGV